MQDPTVRSVAGWMIPTLERLEPLKSFLFIAGDFVGRRERCPIGADSERGPAFVGRPGVRRCHVDLLLLELLSLRAEVKARSAGERSRPLCLFDFIIHHLA